MNDKCYITLISPTNPSKKLVLEFDLFPIDIASRWKGLVKLAQTSGYSIDDPKRFYGLKDKSQDINDTVDKINQICNVINSHSPIIDRKLTDINDQDTLNYLHHIFEIKHGLLDCQTHNFWLTAPKQVQQALADLNIQIHKLESLQRKNLPRFVVTYFGLPKTHKLRNEDFNYMTNDYVLGGLYLNYVEIGKTLEDLMKDNDKYIDDDAFKPWEYFSADFKVMLTNSNTIESRIEKQQCLEYFRLNREFFELRGYKEFDPRLRPGAVHIGQMRYRNADIINDIAEHQFVQSVDFE